MSLAGIEKVSENGCELAVGAPVRPSPPGAAALDLLDFTVDGLADQAAMAGLAMLLAGAPEAPREGKASSDEVSTGAGAE